MNVMSRTIENERNLEIDNLRFLEQHLRNNSIYLSVNILLPNFGSCSLKIYLFTRPYSPYFSSWREAIASIQKGQPLEDVMKSELKR